MSVTRRRLEHLFAVSNLGQARNVVAICRSGGAEETALVVVLGTASASYLARRLEHYLVARGIEARIVTLPETPTAPRPLAVRTIVQTYRGLCAEFDVERLWISNTDVHYGILASLFRADGASICYFEEGLGSYRAADDPAFAGPDRAGESLVALVRRDVEQFFGWNLLPRSLSGARRLARTTRQFWRSLRSHVARRLASKDWYRRFVGCLAGKEALAFFRPWTEFDDARVTFPDLVDPRVITAPIITELVVAPASEEVGQALRVVSQPPRLDVSTLLVSQPYCDRGPVYYGAVAAALRRLDLVEVFVQPHPRERSYNVEELLRSLGDHGIRAVTREQSRDVTAEALLATGCFTRCVAVTSSTLLYGPALFPRVEFVAIGSIVWAEILEREAGLTVDDLRRLKVDIGLLENVQQRLESGLDTD